MAIHPDDPPMPLLGLPRVVSCESDVQHLLAAVDSPHNGLTFCGGSFVESDHLDGDVDMFRIVRTFAREAARRQRDGDAAALAVKSP
ncbi:hypothetical protein EMIHUDRAFT_206423 [Emiliania huxleyi CCMP1516]|uniref:mannonate dehydratase n=2 Tax=Emiliania huxleyi TaxID=2903 RepID=A0A0D3JNZ5_EMIH1|nr:hypothetical protein EMIHUDRAFT_206423 [Emiliania huxleyi CCMP1516]EOD25230.1 hypothetical protein EMIHUDRAFT_206423 [Emiliania huxleyi CCMP1516]|eukprot:XP_005777659.1 hypothetical protein EMIHUDRAFT_206423 [Emiliania huxleyi CCMP1516]